MIDDNPIGLIDELMAWFAAGECSGCDQCDADVVVVHDADGVGVVEIRHDLDCPELARHQQRNRADGGSAEKRYR